MERELPGIIAPENESASVRTPERISAEESSSQEQDVSLQEHDAAPQGREESPQEPTP